MVDGLGGVLGISKVHVFGLEGCIMYETVYEDTRIKTDLSKLSNVWVQQNYL